MMKIGDGLRWSVAATVAGVMMIAGCGDAPTEPTGDEDVNPALLEDGGVFGLADGAAASLPQGSATITGPGGMEMDATGEEFVQQLTLADGTVLRTSGVQIKAVPDESVTEAPFDKITAVAALTGSLASVPPGTYTFMSEVPPINFEDEVPAHLAGVFYDDGSQHGARAWAHSGQLTITSLEYFDDVYTCDFDLLSAKDETCEYQVGLLRGSVEFTASPPFGEVVQPHTTFSVPIRKRTITAVKID